MKLKPKLLVTMAFLSLGSLLATSLISNIHTEKSLKKQVLNQLESLATIQVKRIEAVIDQNHERLALVASRTQLRISLQHYLSDADPESKKKIERILGDAKASIPDFKSIHVFSPDKELIASTTPAHPLPQKNFYDTISERTETPGVNFSEDNNNLVIVMSTPLFIDANFIGILVLQLATEHITAAVQDYTGLGATGETALAQKNADGDTIFLAPLRFAPDAAFKKVISRRQQKLPMNYALNHIIDRFTDVIDYRNVPVFAATQYIPNTPLGIVVKMDKAEALGPLFDIHRMAFMVLLVVSLVVLLLLFHFSRTIVMPIERLAQLADKIGRGTITQKITVTGKDELSSLANAFNVMSERISNDAALRIKIERQLRKYHDTLEELVAQRTMELEKSQTELLKKERLATLGRLVSTIAHDLRNPLATIRAAIFTVHMKYEKKRDKEIDKLLNHADESIIRCDAIIDDLLSFGKERKLVLEPISIDPWLKNTLEKQIHPKGIFFTFDCRANTKCFLDQNHFERVVVNIFTNAIDAVSEPGITEKSITITTSSDKTATYLSFSDTGVGIPEDIREKIFEPLFSTKHLGIGLGMSITKELIIEHNGSITIDSEQGKGTTVIITLPNAET